MKQITQQSPILDIKGKPFDKKALQQEVAHPTVVGVRQPRFMDSVADVLTPMRLAKALRNANAGNDFDMLTLAEEIEERDIPLFSALQIRRLALQALPVHVESASKDEHDEMLAQAVRDDIISKSIFSSMSADLDDAILKGRSTVEPIYNYNGGRLIPEKYIWRDPRYFKFHPDDPTDLRLIDEEDYANGKSIAGMGFITHIPKLKTGITTRSGLVRLAAVEHMCRSFSRSDWMAYSELFGMPIRVGKYGANASEEDQKILKLAVASLGSDAAAILPESMKIELIERSGQNGDQLFLRLAEYLDKQISMLVLGHTGATQETAGKLGGDDNKSDIREDILIGDAFHKNITINRDLIKPYIDLNFGIQKAYPKIVYFVKKHEDTKSLVESLVRLGGLDASKSELRDKLGIKQGEGDDRLVIDASAPLPLDTATNHDQNSCHAQDSCHAQGCSACGTALNRDTSTGSARVNDDIDDLVEASLQDWQEIVEPMISPLQQLANSSETEAEFEAGIDAAIEMMDTTALAKKLSIQTFKARGRGNATK